MNSPDQQSIEHIEADRINLLEQGITVADQFINALKRFQAHAF